MLMPLGVHQLLSLLVKKGWSDFEVQLALASELPPGSLSDDARSKNVELVRNSDGLLAPVIAEILRIVTVVNSHTTACLRIVRASEQPCIKVVPGNESLAGPDGKHMSKERILSMCPSLREPAEQGITYNIVRWQLLPLCKGLMELLAEADNAKHDTFRKETPLQTMFNIHARACSQPTDKDTT